mmetsp:Transcript_21764/g.47293  ORF Transcript_21764/g.47293 Transcript_21764/m.47293 type:complete len:475 (+) Transcript_21764:124-1548(+)
MASRFGRRGEFSPESKELMTTTMQCDDAVDHDQNQKPPAAEKASKRLKPRRTSKSFPMTASMSIPDVSVLTPSKKSVAATNSNIMSPTNVTGVPSGEEGCKVCHRDLDHPNLLLCESCNDEYHTYCLNPPLQSVPEGDFFCDKCKRNHATKDDDGLDSLVSGLPPSYTSRFGEIIWAAGGVGFGWWPACVYDPRLTVGGARQLARKNLGKRHLIYFFECNEAPFTVLGDNRLTKWEDGFIEEYDLGKVAKSGGKNRYTHFERALTVAQLENGRPIEMRMDWNHQEIVPLPKIPKQKTISSPSEQRHKKQKQSPCLKRSSSSGTLLQNSIVNRSNLNMAMNSLNNQGEANAIEPSENGILVCKILRRLPAGAECTAVMEGMEFSINLGFITLPSRQSATFAVIRRAVENDLDDDMLPSDLNGTGKRWKFYVPKLGPMSMKQEGKIGPALEFLKSTTDDVQLGNGTASNPLKVVIM